jgi:DNA-binding transcriptional regulator YdaS (Cro superfamily)
VVTATDTPTAAPSGEPRAGWPLQPLLDASGLSRSRLAVALSLSGVTLRTASRCGLTDRQADQWAIRLGLHPLSVWGWAWIDNADAAAPTAAARFAEVLRGRIARGELRPGDQLPGVHALARSAGVGTKTAARALDELRAEGLVVGTAPNRPSVVASAIPAGLASCVICGRGIGPGEEHYPHKRNCTMAAHGWCDCDQAAHPECCPSCAAGVTA